MTEVLVDDEVIWKGEEPLRPLLTSVGELREDPDNARMHGDRNLEAAGGKRRKIIGNSE